MPGVDDWALAPLRAVDKIFEECGPSGEWRQKAREFFKKEIGQKTVLSKLPWVNETPLHDLRPNQVVRFRGMVQDMFDNEFFLDLYEVRDSNTGTFRLQSGRYKDIAECGAGENIVTDSPRCETGDRLTYYCVPVPGENEWVKKIYQDMNPCTLGASSSNSVSRKKRSVTEESDHYTSLNQCADQTEDTDSMKMEAVEQGENKRTRTEGRNEVTQDLQRSSSEETSGSRGAIDLNFPIPGMKGTPCLVKTYDDVNFSLNDIVEVVGILSIDPAMALRGPDHDGNIEMNTAAMDMEEEVAHCPPPSLVPRLHVLSAQKVSHTNPLLSADLECSGDIAAQKGSMRETRELLRELLQEALLGDALAAEFMICHFVSSVYLRQDVIALGKYSMNLSGVTKGLQEQQYTTCLYNLISSLVTQSHLFSMTLNNMNNTVFTPKKDYKSNRLMSGLLQLSQHTHLVVDETVLTAGQLDAKGVQNLTALGNVINWQKADYDFQYHQIEQHTNIPVLILSEGRAMITSDVEVRLEPKHTNVSTAFTQIHSKLTPDLLQRLRSYLTTARLMSYTLSDEMQKMVQDDFVDSRKNENGITASDLHSLLVLARLVAVSCGETSLTPDIWRSVKILGNEQKLRLNVSSH